MIEDNPDDYYSPDYQNGTPTRHKYKNVSKKDVLYDSIYTKGTRWLNSIVTFKPANIPKAPMMVVRTSKESSLIYLPRSVSEWEIKYYSRWLNPCRLDDKYLKNAGVVNLKQFFGKSIAKGLVLELSTDYGIHPEGAEGPFWVFPDVD